MRDNTGNRVDPYRHMPGRPVGGGALVYGTQPGTVIDPARHLIRTHTHRGTLGSWFTFEYCQKVYGFPQDADARTVERIPAHRRRPNFVHLIGGGLLRPGMKVVDGRAVPA
jgi:hypothetical protein